MSSAAASRPSPPFIRKRTLLCAYFLHTHIYIPPSPSLSLPMTSPSSFCADLTLRNTEGQGTDIYKNVRIRNKQIYRLIGKLPTIAACAYRHRIGRCTFSILSLCLSLSLSIPDRHTYALVCACTCTRICTCTCICTCGYVLVSSPPHVLCRPYNQPRSNLSYTENFLCIVLSLDRLLRGSDGYVLRSLFDLTSETCWTVSTTPTTVLIRVSLALSTSCSSSTPSMR